jgi:hypothetical protein
LPLGYISNNHAFIDHVIVDIFEDRISPIILGRPFLRNVEALVNLHEANMRFELPSWGLFVVHFPMNNKNNAHDSGIITLKVN